MYVKGYEIMDEDVIAIARLRGEGLKELNIPECCIVGNDINDLHVGHSTQGLDNMVCREIRCFLFSPFDPI